MKYACTNCNEHCFVVIHERNGVGDDSLHDATRCVIDGQPDADFQIVEELPDADD
jgi:hypothetical protein